jgi:hypothetical protein
MMNPETIDILVSLLDEYQVVFLHTSRQRVLFLDWLAAHIQTEIYPDTFKARLTAWLLHRQTPKDMYAEVLTIYAEMLWLSKIRNEAV